MPTPPRPTSKRVHSHRSDEEMKQQQPRHTLPQILDSSDEEDGDDDSSSGVHDIRAVYGSLSDNARDFIGRSSPSKKSSDPLDATIFARQNNDDDDEEVETDTDDEIMNPYVMNPFHSLHSNDSHMLGSALLPPSVEMSTMNNVSLSSHTDTSRAPNSLSVEIEHKTQTKINVDSNNPPGRILRDFDPYSPTVRVQTLRKQQMHSELQHHQNQLEQHCNDLGMEMELEAEVEDLGEESVEFFGNDTAIGQERKNSVATDVGMDWHRDFSLFEHPNSNIPSAREQRQQQQDLGGIRDEEREYGDNQSTFSSNPNYTTANEYGESTPLSGPRHFHNTKMSSNGSRQGKTQATTDGLIGVMGNSVVNVIKAVLSSAAYATTFITNGRSPSHSPRFHNHGTSNPFSQPKMKTRHNPRPNHWGILTYFRLFVITMAALFALGTMTIFHQFISADNDGTSSAVRKNLYGGERAADGEEAYLEYTTADGVMLKKPKSLLKKMENAKKKAKGKHWWNRWRRSRQEAAGPPPVEVYRNGVQEAVSGVGDSASSSVGDVNETKKHVKREETLPVVVTTGEDGTVLIKLPPPKMNLEEPDPSMALTYAANTAIVQSSRSFSSAMDIGEEDETLYIRLPYSEEQIVADFPSASKKELEPPLRGASIPSSHSQLTRRPPPPLAVAHEDKKKSHPHHDFHNHYNKKESRHLGYFSHEERRPGVLDALRKEFESWAVKHEKKYGSHDEKEKRFHVWKKNHFRITEKNHKHGPCRLTGKAVFGHNIFSDLDPEEFQQQFLTGYRGPRTHESVEKKSSHSYFRDNTSAPKGRKSGEMYPPPLASIKRHPTIQRKLEEHLQEESGTSYRDRFSFNKYRYKNTKFANGCAWWDVSCMLRWVFGYQYVGGTREPVYDEGSYPSVLDWRSMGVVTDVHSQGSCGACWAITAVETVESAHAIATGTLINLSEHEVIACDGSCQMCNGGWPQNAYKYVMKHGGLPEETSAYDADWLYAVTAVLQGESDEVSDNELASYFAETCPAGVREGEDDKGGGSNSHHSGDENYSSKSNTPRYGNIKGYGYATDRCVCYTDGSGCDCDKQDEKTAVLNVASYGPAAVCLEASLWQDYEGGIMTSDIGCSSKFLDMNHCVQVVGYAFTDKYKNDGENGNENGSRDESRKSGSKDSEEREGYWIVKNQWSNYWGMNGYAYLAMGDNTCGILNDMTQVYME
mmetsp:Transcript_12240/g.23988  ORF Transcript_12240/g.23988 Transcript_12240/m.23988 type:complete len:1209 (+) Transcript_12240:177-3803(+)